MNNRQLELYRLSASTCIEMREYMLQVLRALDSVPETDVLTREAIIDTAYNTLTHPTVSDFIKNLEENNA